VIARSPLFLPVLLLALVLLGCTKQTLRDDAGGDDVTGNIGSPLVGPSPADVYVDLSGAYLIEGRLTEAFMNAKKAVIVDPRSSNAHYILALVYQRLGEQDSADASYQKAISLDPRNPAALNAYGLFLCERKDFDGADNYFRRALTNPLYGTPWIASHNAGSCAEMSGDLESAERDFRAALQANPRFAPSLLSMAAISYRTGYYLSSRGYLQRYAEVAPHTAQSLWLGVQTENQLGDKDQMASYGLKLRNKFPDSEQAKFLQTIE
jgi:type IV pilus assembly protein PilF